MTAQKKTITKSVKSQAPATKNKAAQPAAKKSTPAAATRAKSAKVATAAPAASVAPVRRGAKSAPVVVPVKAKPVVTAIVARVDVGFGNSLYLRGDGVGLSWDQGVMMDCVGDDLWQIWLGESASGFVFKFLVNDQTWSIGPDFTTASGTSVTLSPEF